MLQIASHPGLIFRDVFKNVRQSLAIYFSEINVTRLRHPEAMAVTVGAVTIMIHDRTQ
jgi:hypothetical protein